MVDDVVDILIVEDDVDVRDLLVARAKQEGWHIRVAEDGEKCIEQVKEKKPDIILLDIMMPKMDGYNACFMIKEDPQYSGIPIIMITAKTEPFEEIKGKMVGADEYICKPFDLNETFDIIKKHLSEN